LRETFKFFQKDECPMRRDLKALAARLTDEVVVYPNQVILRFAEENPIVIVGSGRNLSLLRAAQPSDGIVVRATAAGTLEASRPLLRLLGEKLSFVHARSVPH